MSIVFISAGGPTCDTTVLIAGATGTNIGDMTGGGGLAAAFDDNASQGKLVSARKLSGGEDSYIGKDWGAGVTKWLSHIVMTAPTDAGFRNAGTETITFTVYGNNSAPANSSDGTQIGSGTVTDAQSGPVTKDITGLDTTTAYRYHWVKITWSASTEASNCAECDMYGCG